MIAPPPLARPSERLDPRTILLDFVRVIGRFAWLGIIFLSMRFMGRQGDSFELIATSFAVVGAIGSLYQWLTVRYGIVGENFVYEVIGPFKSEKTVPLDRIQAVHIERTVAHRMLGLAKVNVDTAVSSQEAEISLDSLKFEQAEALRNLLLRATPSAPVQTAQLEHILWQASPKTITLAGVTQNAWFIIVGGALSLLPFLGRGDDSIRGEIQDIADQPGLRQLSPLLWAGIILGLLTLGWIVSIIRSWIQYYGFTLTQGEGRLHREYGLFNQRRNSISLRRVQSLVWETTWLRRWVGFWQVKCHTAGAMTVKEDPTSGGLLSPVVETADMDGFSRIVFPDLDWTRARWQGAAPGSLPCRTVNNFLGWMVLVTPLLIWQGLNLWWLMPAVLAYSTLAAWLDVRNYRFSFTGRFALCQRGWKNTSLQIIPLDKVQAISYSQGPLQRRFGIADITLDIAGGPALHLDYVPVERARLLAERSTSWIAATGSWSPDGV